MVLPTQRHPIKAKDRVYADESDANDARRDDTDCSEDNFEVDVRHVRLIRPLNDLFQRVMYYIRYLLHNRSGRYNDKVSSTVPMAGKRMALPVKSVNFSGDDPVAVLMSCTTATCGGP